MKRALTIAGSDSGGGAGIQADLKTFGALGVYGTSAITAVTAQNTLAVTRIQEIDPDVVAAQIDAVAQDIGLDAAKTGMLWGPAIIEVVADAVKRHRMPNLVVDPVTIAKSGARLLKDEAITLLKTRLLPLAEIVTPNIPEAEALTGVTIHDVEGMREAAKRIQDLGVQRVVIKGGHSKGPYVVDLFYDGREFQELKAERVDTRSTHGTGCTFSAAIAAYLAHGLTPLDAVARAKEFLTAALRAAPGIGQGFGPLNHFHAFHTS
ncbi:MAG TPA: bifunctional hydroxymethylpyrimidine kinase/phosphomethylpyrimidine kinase [Candidatus Polarisedimenticolia bacterium]|nr:bifunctional hydroxymethylpyrimidine kinase/phosphomethylpyrimidine kinase [Candidatus Polarisedimenticolia bacterium]